MTTPSSSSSTPPDRRPPSVEAAVEYLGEMAERPRYHLADPTRDRNVLQRVTVKITNGRPRQHEWTLDRDGFALVPHRTSLVDFRNPEAIHTVYSLWRAFSPPPEDVPLALCEATSVASEDAVLSDVVMGLPPREIVFEGCNFRHNPRHRWIYFRDMHRDELLLIKAYDSDEQRAWRVPHTGFLDPSAPSDAPPRQSVDIRAVAFFDS